jgi:flagellar assembly protein FliH
MRATAKYLFNEDFSAAPEGRSAVSLTEHQAKVKDAEAQAFTRALAQARADAAQRSAAALERIAAALHSLTGTLAAVEAQLETEAVEVAVAVARKLAPELIAREPFAEIAALATDCLRHLRESPHVVVRVHDTLFATAETELGTIARQSGFAGRLIVLAEPGIAPGDCRIEWADGGVKRDRKALAAAIDETVARYVEGRRAAATMPEISWGFDR